MKYIIYLAFAFCLLPNLLSAQMIVRDSTWHYQGWDSHPDWDLTQKTYYNYDNEGRITSDITYDVQAFPPADFGRADYTYNAEGLLEKVDRYLWDAVLGDWGISKETFYTYDANQNITMQEDWSYFPPSSIYKARNEYQYDENNLLTSYTFSSWSPGWGWNTETSTVYTYDGNQNLLTSTSYSFGGTDQRIYTYDNLNRRITWEDISTDYYGYLYSWNNRVYHYTAEYPLADSMSTASYDAFLEVWEDTRWNHYSYDSNGNLVLDLHRQWVTPDSIWRDYYQAIYSYDGNDNTTEIITQYFNADLGEWVNQSRRANEYNGMNLSLDEYANQYWSSDSSQWVGGAHYLREYDGEGHPLVEETLSWDSGIWDYHNNTKDLHFWSALATTGIENQPQNIRCDFPNPISQGETIVCEGWEFQGAHTFRIHDLQGRLVHKRIFTGQQPLQFLAPIPSGLYLFSIETAGQVIMVKKVWVN
jgi:hypothetical protein